MKFVFDDLPVDASFNPIEPEWKKIWAPRPVYLALFGLVLAIATCHLLGKLFLPPVRIGITYWTLIVAFALYGALIPASLLVEWLVLPRAGTKTVGWSRNKHILFLHHNGVIYRNRLIFVRVSPFLVFCLLPILVIWFFNLGPSPLQVVPLILGIFCGADLSKAILLLALVPNRAMIRAFGWNLYWSDGSAPPNKPLELTDQ